MRRASRRRPARWAKGSATPSAWRWRSGCSTPASATISSITTPMSSPATAASWRASARRRSRSPDICASASSSCCGTTIPSRSTAAPTSRHPRTSSSASRRPDGTPPRSTATRQASGSVLDALAPVMPELVGGSADLTGSNNTKVRAQTTVTSDNFAGNYVHYGVREHGMAAAMNGLSVHGGVIPYGGTFLVFADYCRPAIRLAALMGLRVIHVMTHDSIGLGEDGPTHQPVEHLASLRAIPNLQVFRPADAVETAECWELALRARHRPSGLALSRPGVPALRRG